LKTIEQWFSEGKLSSISAIANVEIITKQKKNAGDKK